MDLKISSLDNSQFSFKLSSYFPGSGTIQELPGISAELIEVHRLYEDKNLTFRFKHFGNFKTCK